MRLRRISAWAAFAGTIVAACSLAACGGGGGSSSSSLPSGGGSNTFTQSTPQPSTTTSSFSATTTVTVAATAGPQAVPLPSAAGFSGQATLPLNSVPSGTQLTQTLTSTAPTGIPALAVLRQAASLRRAMDAQTQTILYLCFSSNNSLTLAGDPTFTIALPANYASLTQSFALAYFQNGSWSLNYAGPATANAGEVQLTGSSAISIGAQTATCFALYESTATPAPTVAPSAAPTATPSQQPSSTQAPTATPRPTATPTPTPTSSSGGGNVGLHLAIPTPAPIYAVQSSLTFPAAGQTQQVLISEAGYSGNFSATTTNPNVATATTGLDSGNNPIVIITSTGPGSCTINLSSSNQGTGAISVLVL